MRLVGAVDHVDTQTGEARTLFDTTGEPDGVLLKACGTRRAARCPPCAEVYRADAYQLLKAGLAGGKGVPETIGGHPRLFVTFTAPSFGPVHSSRVRAGRTRVCRPARAGSRCQHGRPAGCPARHLPGDPALGSPLCLDCYDYAATVVWNALASKLWRRTSIYLRRTLARRAGLTVRQLKGQLRIAYAKVAEYQARGAVHFHVVIRLDSPEHTPPPGWASAELLAAAIRQTAATVRLPGPHLHGQPFAVGWGEQVDVRAIGDQAGALPAARVAGYVAKYATKATEHLGLDRPMRDPAQLENLAAPEHIRRLATACWALGGRRELAGLGLRRWAHMLGFGGHATTKSRAYSVTFRALRAARRAWTAIRRHGPTVQLDRDGRLLPPAGMVVAGWEYAGRGYITTADAWLAACMAAQARDARRLAREELNSVA